MAIIHVQFIPDKNAPQAYAGVGNADELKKFKQLYDEGTLTKEEYEEKKKQLLRAK